MENSKIIYDVIKYKAKRVGDSTIVWAITKHPTHKTVGLAIGELERARSKRYVKATSEFAGEVGVFGNCTDAKKEIIKAFEDRQQKSLEDLEKRLEKILPNSIDNVTNKIYTNTCQEDKNTNSEKENETMKNSIGAIKMESTVEGILSKTRKQNEDLKVEFKETFAMVHSQSGSSYVVTRNSCTCHDHFYRHTECRHMKAVSESIKSLRFW